MSPVDVDNEKNTTEDDSVNTVSCWDLYKDNSSNKKGGLLRKHFETPPNPPNFKGRPQSQLQEATSHQGSRTQGFLYGVLSRTLSNQSCPKPPKRGLEPCPLSGQRPGRGQFW
mmetsp:Transcript_36918/g.98087  ORF Transcript_36918/g.98087 Transcript_36918/m.98087 type:complete len:113 (-) Transcript_36918:833-1171(-)